MTSLDVHEIPAEKFFTGFFDQISENSIETVTGEVKFYLTGYFKINEFMMVFYSEHYDTEKGINGMIESGLMQQNGVKVDK